MTDEELFRIAIEEQQRSIGFDLDADLVEQRQQALDYYKGDMTDVNTMPNRSKAVSMDVRDGIQAVMPDLLDIFTGGEDVAVFIPKGEEDEDQARQETDYLNHVVFTENDGFSTFNAVILDALQCKTGVFKWYAEEGYQAPDEKFTGKTLAEVQMASQGGEIIDPRPSEEYGEEPLYDFTLRPTKEDDKICISSVAPEDLTVARDTVRLCEATYCATRSYPRAQDLVAQGLDKDLITSLPEWDNAGDNIVQMARDTVDETVSSSGSSNWMMRQVLVYEHYLRIKTKKGEKLYCILTGGYSASAVLLRIEEVERIQLAAVTPYTVSHRFYGNSMADMLIDIQRIKSQLQRMMLDSGYFALNQRHEVATSGANEDTIPDLLRNEPGVPIRVKTAGTVTPIQSPGLNFDTQSALEYFSTVAEERTGSIRASQGLNPDTLHDTKGGMLALLSRAQRRTRMIARTFAETGVKDFFLGVHALVRQTATKSRRVRLNRKWVEVDPSNWAARNDMSIEIGLGAGGKEHDLIVMGQVLDYQQAVIQGQGGFDGPIVTAENVYNALTAFVEKSGQKNPNLYFSDPKDAPEPPEPPPNPEMVKVEADIEQKKAQHALDEQRALGEYEYKQAELAFRAEQAERDDRFRRDQAEAELAFKQHQYEQELALKQWEVEQQLQIERERMVADVGKHQMSTDADLEVASNVHLGGEPG